MNWAASGATRQRSWSRRSPGSGPAAAVAGRLHAETGGKPLALVELSAALTAEQLGGAEMPEVPLPPGAVIRQRFAARLDRLSPPARTALLIAAAAGRCPAAEVAIRRAASGWRWQRYPAIGEAEAAGLVRITGDGIAFSSAAAVSGVFHAAGRAQRRAAHHALAHVLGWRVMPSVRLAPGSGRDRAG